MVDVLLVVLIFLMVSTSYSRFTELKIQLPVANSDPAQRPSQQIVVAITTQGDYAINGVRLEARDVTSLAAEMRRVAHTSGSAQPLLVIHADAQASHQSVVRAMEAARLADLPQLTIATQTSLGETTP